MAIIRTVPKSGRAPSLRGSYVIDTVRGVLRVRKWPKKRGPPRSASQRFWVDWFTQANRLAKYADGMAQVRAMEMTKLSGMYPRDVFLKAMRGRLYSWVDQDGWKWFSVAAIQDISDALDILGQTVGDILVRASDRWRPPPAGVQGQVLTHQGPTASPVWAPVAGVGGFQGGALVHRSSSFSLPNNVLTVIPFNAETYDTDNIHDNVTNPSRLTVPTGTGWVVLTFYIQIGPSQVGYRWIEIQKNGALFTGMPRLRIPPTGFATALLTIVSAVIQVIAGDYFEALAFQNSGSAKNIGVNPPDAVFSMQML